MERTGTRDISKEALLTRMDDAWASFGGPALGLGVRGLRERTPTGWTYAQMLAHVRAWHELTAWRLRAFRETGEVGLPGGDAARAIFTGLGLSAARSDELLREWDTDGFNAAVAEAAAAASPHGLLPSLFASYKKVRGDVVELSDEQLAAHVSDGRSFVDAMLEGNTYGHYAEHQDELTSALPETAQELVARVDADWTRVRDAVRRKGRSGIADPALDGWIYKDLLAHVIGWLHDVPRRLAAIRAGTDRPIAGAAEIDAYNARSVSERRLVGPEAILDELNTAFHLVREAVAGLSDEEVQDRRIRGLVATRTYLHWDEHEQDLGL